MTQIHHVRAFLRPRTGWGLGPPQRHLWHLIFAHVPRIEKKAWETFPCRICSQRGGALHGYDASATLKDNYLCALLFSESCWDQKNSFTQEKEKGTEIVRINTTSQTVWLCWARVSGFCFVFPFFVKMLSGTAAGHRQLLSLRCSAEEGRKESPASKSICINHQVWYQAQSSDPCLNKQVGAVNRDSQLVPGSMSPETDQTFWWPFSSCLYSPHRVKCGIYVGSQADWKQTQTSPPATWDPSVIGLDRSHISCGGASHLRTAAEH